METMIAARLSTKSAIKYKKTSKLVKQSEFNSIGSYFS
jgi:3-deoxy-D-manno-octulosonic-acid transferase